MPDNDPIKMVEAFFEAWNAQDWDRWAALHAEDVYHAGPDHPHPLVGREAVLAAHKGLGGVFPDFRYDLTRLFANGDLVCAEWVLAATHRGPLPGPGGKAEATGRPVKVPRWLAARSPSTSAMSTSSACTPSSAWSRPCPATSAAADGS